MNQNRKSDDLKNIFVMFKQHYLLVDLKKKWIKHPFSIYLQCRRNWDAVASPSKDFVLTLSVLSGLRVTRTATT